MARKNKTQRIADALNSWVVWRDSAHAILHHDRNWDKAKYDVAHAAEMEAALKLKELGVLVPGMPA